MTATASNVHDLVYSSPASLKEISCNALVIGLWRWEVENRTNDDFDQFLSELDLCKNLDPIIPSPVKRIIDDYIKRFMTSMENWSSYHCVKLRHFHRNDEDCILHDFYDFICERNGALIHYIRTARQMMICDLLSNDEKFKIACMYCFENDVRRIWPSVSEKLDLNEVDFDRNSQLFYWICMLKNELDRIPNPDNDPIDVVMLRVSLHSPYHWSSMVYFWNRICPENQFLEAINLSRKDEESFVRFILPKLNDQLLDRFVAARSSTLIYDLWISNFDKFCVLPTWMYVKNKMNESNFTDLIGFFMHDEAEGSMFLEAISENSAQLDDWSGTADKTYLCCEIWRTSPEKFKRSAIKYILIDNRSFSKRLNLPIRFMNIRFLLTVLLDASFENRHDFWEKNWRDLICRTLGKDLQRIMKLCFKNEEDIATFKETMLFAQEHYANICPYAITLLEHGYFEELDDFFIFCCPETQIRKIIKQHFLQKVFFHDNFEFTLRHLIQVELMNEFINDAFDNADLVDDFNHNLFLKYFDENFLYEYCGERIGFSRINYLIPFIDAFVRSEQDKMALKRKILNYVRDFLINGGIVNVSGSVGDLQTVLLWCLGNEDEITNFKQSLPSSDLFGYEKCKVNLFELRTINPIVGEFLEWYFRSPEEIEEFQREFSPRCDFQDYVTRVDFFSSS